MFDQSGREFELDRDFMAWVRDGATKTMVDVEDDMQAPSEQGDEQEAAPFVLPVFVVPVPLYSARQEAPGPAGLQG